MLSIFIVILIYITIGFLFSIYLKRNDIADVMWGPGIFLAVLTSQILKGSSSYIVLAIIFLWSLRIFIHIGKRFISKKEEDFRYANWRKTWSNFYIRSYLQIFLLQGFLMLLVSSSIVLINLYEYKTNQAFILFGAAVSVFALVFEATADAQLKNFLAKKSNKIMQTGLWKYSRHPNYFGEVLFWWGIYFTTLPNLNPIFLISPVTITFLILYVSGIPMLEKKYIDNKEFEIYKSKTNAFFPWRQKIN
jgi:steroid 5-alpha reductase family enzyme